MGSAGPRQYLDLTLIMSRGTSWLILWCMHADFMLACIVCCAALCTQELLSYGRTVLTAHSASALIRWWDLYWAKYQQKLMAAREQRKELVMRRKMAALGLDWNEDG